MSTSSILDGEVNQLGDDVMSAATPIRYYHVLTVGIICFLLGAILSFIATMHCHRIVFGTSEGGATGSSVAVAASIVPTTTLGQKTVVNGNGAVIMATPFDDDEDDVGIRSSAFYRLPTGVQRLVVSRATPSGGGDSVSYTGDNSTRTATNSSQVALMDFRQYYHRTNSTSAYSRTSDRT